MVLYNPKTKTLFQRDDKFKVITGQLTDERFGYIDKWLLTEKMDGTSVIISTKDRTWSYHGRTAKSQFTPAMAEFLDYQSQSAANNLWHSIIPQADIYAELFGEGIQGNPHGMKGMHLRVFDVRIGDFWLDYENMCDVSDKAGLNTVAYLGTVSVSDAVGFVKERQRPVTGFTDYVEGVVARTPKYLYDNQGTRLVWKLKRKDFA